MEKTSKNRNSLFKDANRHAAENNLTCEFNNTNTILKDIDGQTTQINSQSPHTIKDPLRQALQKKCIENMKEHGMATVSVTNVVTQTAMKNSLVRLHFRAKQTNKQTKRV